jgi:hypothetical protein
MTSTSDMRVHSASPKSGTGQAGAGGTVATADTPPPRR